MAPVFAPPAELRHVEANGLRLAWDSFGNPADPAVLLIMGLSCQLVHWPRSLCQQLADAGLYVVRFDNRDMGASTRLSEAGTPDIVRTYLRSRLGLRVQVPYRLDDLANDTLGLMDALQLQDAHVVGLSMGGMVAQIMAARAPQRVRALTLMMTTSGARGVPGPSLRIRRRMIQRPAGRDRDSLIAHSMATWRVIGSPAYPAPEPELRSMVETAFERGFHAAGSLRQMAAIVASGSRASLLPKIAAPTQVLHGEADPLVPLAAGHDLARRIPGARLITFPGMGHDLPSPLLPTIANRLIAHDPALAPVANAA